MTGRELYGGEVWIVRHLGKLYVQFQVVSLLTSSAIILPQARAALELDVLRMLGAYEMDREALRRLEGRGDRLRLGRQTNSTTRR